MASSRVLTEEEVYDRLMAAYHDQMLSPADDAAVTAWACEEYGTVLYHAYPAALRAVGIEYDGTHYREVGGWVR